MIFLYMSFIYTVFCSPFDQKLFLIFNPSNEFAEGPLNIHMYNLQCSSTAESLSDCTFSDRRVNRVCKHNQDVAIECTVPEQCPLTVSR